MYVCINRSNKQFVVVSTSKSRKGDRSNAPKFILFEFRSNSYEGFKVILVDELRSSRESNVKVVDIVNTNMHS